MLGGSREAESNREVTSEINEAATHLLHGQAAFCTWEPLSQDGPQMGLPQAGTIHLRGQGVNLGLWVITGLVRQLEEFEINY